MAKLSWQVFFKDEQLQDLIKQGLEHNLDLKMSLEHINKSYALLKGAKAAFLPDLNLAAGVKQSRLADAQSYGMMDNSTQYDLYATTSWEIDVWGKLASHKRASFYRFNQSKAVRQALQTQIIAQIASYYYQLVVLDQQQLILEKTIENRAIDIQTMLKLKESNIVTGAAVVQSEANYYDAKASLPGIKRQINQVENALRILIGKTPDLVKRGSYDDQALESYLSVGVPFELLENRPDVKASELELSAYFEEVHAAKRAFYPSLTITAAAGFSSVEFKNWFSASGFFANVTSGLMQPIFNKRLNKTKLEIARASYKEKAYEFEKTLLVAGQEVSDALYSYESAKKQEEYHTIQVEKLNLAVEYTKKLLVYHSSTNYTDVLTSEQAFLQAQMQITNDRLLKWQSIIKLYRSLGGGAF